MCSSDYIPLRWGSVESCGRGKVELSFVSEEVLVETEDHIRMYKKLLEIERKNKLELDMNLKKKQLLLRDIKELEFSLDSISKLKELYMVRMRLLY